MIGRLKPHAHTKESQAPGLGEVPAHWELRDLRKVLRKVSARDRSDLALLSVVREKGVVLRDRSRDDKNHNFIPDDLSNYKVVRAGQLAMNKMKAWQGSYGVSPYDGIVSPAYFVFELFGVDGAFFHRAIRSRAYVPFFAQASDGVRIGQWDLSQARMKSIPFLIPPANEQIAIVLFLDYADRRIQRAIAAKQKLIKLLEEQKQAIIHRAVTRGLDPEVRLKPSGVEWLGDVPAHWRVLPLKRACMLVKDGTHLPPPRQGRGYPLLSVRNIVSSTFIRRPDDSLISEFHFAELCRSFVPLHQDVLLAIVGATIGKVAIVPEMGKFHIQRSLAMLRVKPEVLSCHFLAAFLRGPAFQRALWMSVAFSAQPGIYLNSLRSFSVVLPPLDEQNAIVEALNAELRELDRAIATTRSENLLLREYRTRLVADVVTGKLDVRDAAARLPNEVEAAEVNLDVRRTEDEHDFDGEDDATDIEEFAA